MRDPDELSRQTEQTLASIDRAKDIVRELIARVDVRMSECPDCLREVEPTWNFCPACAEELIPGSRAQVLAENPNMIHYLKKPRP